MFIIVVALLFVVIIGVVNFTDFVDNGFPALKSALSEALRRYRPRH